MALARRPVRGCGDPGISEIDLGYGDCRMFGLDVRLLDCVTAIECGELTFLGSELGPAARQCSLRPLQIGLTFGEQARVAVCVCHSSLKLLPRRCLRG